MVGDLLGARGCGQKTACSDAGAEQEETTTHGEGHGTSHCGAPVDEEHGCAEYEGVGNRVRTNERQQQYACGEQRPMAFPREGKDGNAKREGQKRCLHAAVAHHQRDGPAGGQQPHDLLFGWGIAERARNEPAGARDAQCPEYLDPKDHIAAGEQIDSSDDQRIEQTCGAREVLVEIEGEVAVLGKMSRRAEGDVGVFLQRMDQEEGNPEKHDEGKDQPCRPRALDSFRKGLRVGATDCRRIGWRRAHAGECPSGRAAKIRQRPEHSSIEA